MDNLNKNAIKAVKWSLVERFGQQGIQFIVSVFLARLLLPEEFGLIAMLSIFVAFGNSFIDSGFQKALIQKKELTHLDECSVFYFNILIALIVAGLMFLSAPLISQFYNQSQLVAITRALSIVFLFSSFGLVQDSLLAKKLDFKTVSKINLSSYILSGVSSVAMALNGFGVWSLVVLNVGGTFLRTIFLWIFSSWRPALLFSFASLGSMFSFGSRLFIVSLTNSVFKNIYQVIIGKFFSASSLGFYSRAKTLSMYPVSMLTSVVNQVSFPVFSKIQDDKTRLKIYMRKTLTMLTLITFPLMIGVAVVAKQLILILLTEKWLPSVPFFQMLCVVGTLYPIHVVNLNVLNARGRSDLFLKIEVINKVLMVLVVLITYRFGITAMIWGQILNTFIAYYLYAYYSGKHLNYTIGMQIKDMLPSLSVSLLMGIIIYSIKYIVINNDLILLTMQV
ncbi:MAG: lipopolysaccharide biosynthesis protein, partial [Bacteroidetes bacterium]|nr:lipopolysaccharide biosynthesis protein [Bacteroidota bacterium]